MTIGLQTQLLQLFSLNFSLTFLDDELLYLSDVITLIGIIYKHCVTYTY